MKISSREFNNNSNIPKKFTCDGEDISPSLIIEDVPDNAESLVLIMDDPDAPIEGGWVHWLVWNIDPKTREIAENSILEDAIQGKNTRGNNKYGGPCPPSGTHRYFFRLYALDEKLDLLPTTNRNELCEAMKVHIIDQSELVGLYSRS